MLVGTPKIKSGWKLLVGPQGKTTEQKHLDSEEGELAEEALGHDATAEGDLRKGG
jgi:hypothetical protein